MARREREREEVHRRQIREENGERQRCKGGEIKREKEKSREHRGREEFGKHSSLHSLPLQLYHLHSNNRGSASAESLLLNNRAGGREGLGAGAVGGLEVLSLPQPRTKQSLVWTEWHFMAAKPISSLYTPPAEEPALSVSACTYIDIKQRAAFSSSSL